MYYTFIFYVMYILLILYFMYIKGIYYAFKQ